MQFVQPALHPRHGRMQPLQLRHRILGDRRSCFAPRRRRMTTGPMARPPVSGTPLNTRGTVAASPSSTRLAAPGALQDLTHEQRDDLHLLHEHRVERMHRHVLDGDHADGAPRPAHRYSQHRREFLFAGFGSERESGMMRRVRQVHHSSGGGAEPDDPLADPQPGSADRGGIQSLGGQQLQHVTRTFNVDGAHLEPGFLGNQPRQGGERRAALGEHGPHAPQQSWRPGGSFRQRREPPAIAQREPRRPVLPIHR